MRQRPASTVLAVGIGAAAVLLQAVTLPVVWVVDPAFVSAPTPVPGFEDWHAVLTTLGVFGSLAIASLALPVGVYAVGVQREDLADAVPGFVAGGLVFGVGTGAIGWAVSQPPFGPVRHLLRTALWLFGLFLALALLGALAGDVGRSLTERESDHERW